MAVGSRRESESGGQAAQCSLQSVCQIQRGSHRIALAWAAFWVRAARIPECRARPRGGCAPLLSCFVRFLGPPNAPPLSGGGGIASTLLLTRSRIDTGSRCARTPRVVAGMGAGPSGPGHDLGMYTTRQKKMDSNHLYSNALLGF